MYVNVSRSVQRTIADIFAVPHGGCLSWFLPRNLPSQHSRSCGETSKAAGCDKTRSQGQRLEMTRTSQTLNHLRLEASARVATLLGLARGT